MFFEFFPSSCNQEDVRDYKDIPYTPYTYISNNLNSIFGVISFADLIRNR